MKMFAMNESAERLLDKYRGCLIGGAVGDALGYAVEFSRLVSHLELNGN